MRTRLSSLLALSARLGFPAPSLLGGAPTEARRGRGGGRHCWRRPSCPGRRVAIVPAHVLLHGFLEEDTKRGV